MRRDTTTVPQHKFLVECPGPRGRPITLPFKFINSGVAYLVAEAMGGRLLGLDVTPPEIAAEYIPETPEVIEAILSSPLVKKGEFSE